MGSEGTAWMWAVCDVGQNKEREGSRMAHSLGAGRQAPAFPKLTSCVEQNSEESVNFTHVLGLPVYLSRKNCRHI